MNIVNVNHALCIAVMAAFPCAALSMQPRLSATAADVVFDGEGPGEGFGSRVLSVGDTDGDRVNDILVAARFSDAAGPDSGRVFIFSGATWARLADFTGEGPGDELGHRHAVVGDLDGDDLAEIVIGAYLNDATGDNAGRVYVFSGGDFGLRHTWSGEAPDDQFGFVLESAGDTDRGGHNDIFVTSPFNDEAGAKAGKVYLYDGADGQVRFTILGEATGDAFGYRIVSVGDVDDDQRDDFAVSAYLNDEAALDAGKVYLFSGGTGALIHTWAGDVENASLGERLAVAGDVDNDGTMDILMGSLGAPNRPGQVFVGSGRDGSIIHQIPGSHGRDRFGERVRSAGDIDGDNHDDILIGAHFSSQNGTHSGAVTLVSGRTGEVIYEWIGEDAGDMFGRVAIVPGDLNGDGVDDIVIGAHGHDGAAIDAGRLYLFSGRTGTCLATWDGEGAGDDFAHTCRPVGDLNGDGLVDLGVGAVHAINTHGVDSGRAYVLFSHPMYVGVNDAVAGEDSEIVLAGALPNEIVILFASLYSGGLDPFVVPGLGGLALDLDRPILWAAPVQADDDGNATLRAEIPWYARGYTIYVQAAVRRGETGDASVKSNVFGAAVR